MSRSKGAFKDIEVHSFIFYECGMIGKPEIYKDLRITFNKSLYCLVLFTHQIICLPPQHHIRGGEITMYYIGRMHFRDLNTDHTHQFICKTCYNHNSAVCDTALPREVPYSANESSEVSSTWSTSSSSLMSSSSAPPGRSCRTLFPSIHSIPSTPSFTSTILIPGTLTPDLTIIVPRSA